MKISERSYFGLKVFSKTVFSDPSLLKDVIFGFPKEWANTLKKRGKTEKTVREAELSLQFLMWEKNKYTSKTVQGLSLPELEKKLFCPCCDISKKYIMKPEVLELCKKIRLGKFQWDWLKNIKSQKSTYLTGKDCFYRFQRHLNILDGGFFSKQSAAEFEIKNEYGTTVNKEFLSDYEKKQFEKRCQYAFNWNLFSINFAQRVIEIDNEKYGFDDKKLMESPSYLMLIEFIQFILFICLSDATIEVLPPNTKTTGTRAGGKIINSSSSDVVIVGSNWNITSVRTEGFKVGGHLRAQPCGKGRRSVKLIWVDAFEKYGYIRRSNKDIIH